MDTEVSFFTSDRLESFGYTKSKEKKEKFDRETNVEKTFFWRLSTATRIPRVESHLNIFQEKRKEAWQRRFSCIVESSLSRLLWLSDNRATLNYRLCGAQSNDLFFASCMAHIETRFTWKYDTEFLFSTILDRESFSCWKTVKLDKSFQVFLNSRVEFL